MIFWGMPAPHETASPPQGFFRIGRFIYSISKKNVGVEKGMAVSDSFGRKAICFYFQVHQPYRLRNYSVFDIGKSHSYFDNKKNREVMQKVCQKCYLPANRLMLDLISESDGRFRISYSLTGTALEQFEEHAPNVLDTFRELASTGAVEFLDETYHHSISFLYSKAEFAEQVQLHRQAMKSYFGQEPSVFRNTELIYNNELAHFIEGLGYKGIIAEGADHILGWRAPNYLYRPTTTTKIALLLKNYRLSDDIAFRFSNADWKEHPLTVEKYTNWINAVQGDTVNLFMDYETFGEHQWSTTGIFRFMQRLPGALMQNPSLDFRTPSEVIDAYKPVSELDIHNLMSWADVERDLSAWLGNSMQHSAMHSVYKFEEKVKATGDPQLISDWRRLTTSDHFYYMCTKWFADGDVHKYFNPYDSPYDSFICFMNALNDIRARVNMAKAAQQQSKQPLSPPLMNAKMQQSPIPIISENFD